MTTTTTHRCSRTGFTLLELLVVIGIIAILAGLLIALVPQIRLKVKIADTQVKMNSVQQGMSLIGQSEGSATYRLQQLTEYRSPATPSHQEPGLGGILTFGPPPATGADAGLPTIGKRPAPKDMEDNGAWGKRSRGHLAFPWGKKFPDPSVTGASSSLMGPERFRLRDMSPFNTRKLLKIANILPTRQDDVAWAEKQYMTNRKPSEIWNDAWGNPLVVAAVLYQPTHDGASVATATGNVPGYKEGAWPAPTDPTKAVDPKTAPRTGYVPTNADDPKYGARKSLLEHLKLYQYNRSVYIAVAAVGPHPWIESADLKSDTVTKWASSATAPTTGTGNLDILWEQANWVCQQAKENEFDRDWTELAMDNPMWVGNKYDYLNKKKRASDMNASNYETKYATYMNGDDHCMLSAPQEYK